jgi:hypothetical protein
MSSSFNFAFVSVLLFVPLMLVGALLTFFGLRGRVIGDDPHCRKCGFNLRGRDPGSTRCPECGVELTDKAIRTGLCLRRRGMLATGLFILLVGSAALSVGGWQFAKTYDWSAWKPTSWLVADLDSSLGPTRQIAIDELTRRINNPSFAQSKVDNLVDRLLARQADQSKKWDQLFGKLLEAAAKQNRVDKPRLERYLRQGLTAKLELKSRLRRKQRFTTSIHLQFERYAGFTQVNGSWHMSPLKFGDAVVRETWAEQRSPQQLAGSIGYSTSVGSDAWKKLNLPDGKYAATSKVIANVSMTEPIQIGPVEIEVAVSAPVEILPANAVVDEFKVDESLRQEMRKAFTAARVLHDEKGRADVRVKAAHLPMPVSAEVVLVQGDQEQVAGVVLIEEDRSARWASTFNRPKLKFTGMVDIHLRPKQDPADGTRQIKTYWGEPIVIKGVQVDAPYDPPFNRDESLRPTVEKAFSRPTLRWENQKTGDITVSVDVNHAPTKLAYQIYLRAGGKEYTSPNIELDMAKDSGYSYGRSTKFPETTATKADVIFRPDKDWEIHTYDADPPWGGEIIFRDVPISGPLPP